MKLTEDIRWKIFEICKAENLDRIERGIVNKGLTVIKKQTKSNLRASFPAAFHKSPYYTDTISEGVMSSVQPRGQEMLGKVARWVEAMDEEDGNKHQFKQFFEPTLRGFSQCRLFLLVICATYYTLSCYCLLVC